MCLETANPGQTLLGCRLKASSALIRSTSCVPDTGLRNRENAPLIAPPTASVLVDSVTSDVFVLAAPGVTVMNDGTDLLRVSGTTAEQIGAAACRAGLPLSELTPTHASLEEAFMQVTKDSIEYHAGATL